MHSRQNDVHDRNQEKMEVCESHKPEITEWENPVFNRINTSIRFFVETSMIYIEYKQLYM